MDTTVDKLLDRRNVLMNSFGLNEDGAVRDRIKEIDARLLHEHDICSCTKCGTMEFINLLDGKRPASSVDENDDYSELHCIACYGPGWLPTGGDEDIAMSVHPPYAPLYAAWSRAEDRRIAHQRRADRRRELVSRVAGAIRSFLLRRRVRRHFRSR